MKGDSQMTPVKHRNHISSWNSAGSHERDILKEMKLIRCLMSLQTLRESSKIPGREFVDELDKCTENSWSNTIQFLTPGR